MEGHTDTTNKSSDSERLERLLHLKEQEKQTLWNNQVLSYMAIAGLAFSGVNVYTALMTRVSSIETRIDYITQLVTELKTDIKELRKK